MANYLPTRSLTVYWQRPWFYVSKEVFSLHIYDSDLPSTFQRRLNLQRKSLVVLKINSFVNSYSCFFSQGAETKDHLLILAGILHPNINIYFFLIYMFDVVPCGRMQVIIKIWCNKIRNLPVGIVNVQRWNLQLRRFNSRRSEKSLLLFGE